MRFTTQRWAAFRVKSFKAVSSEGSSGVGRGGGGGWRLEIAGGGATSQSDIRTTQSLLKSPAGDGCRLHDVNIGPFEH